MTTVSIPTPQELAERMKRDILTDVRSGVVPRWVRDFSHLHDFTDANCYGGTEKLLEDLSAAGPDTDEAHVASLDVVVGLCNVAQVAVDEWIKSKQMLRDLNTSQGGTS